MGRPISCSNLTATFTRGCFERVEESGRCVPSATALKELVAERASGQGGGWLSPVEATGLAGGDGALRLGRNDARFEKAAGGHGANKFPCYRDWSGPAVLNMVRAAKA